MLTLSPDHQVILSEGDTKRNVVVAHIFRASFPGITTCGSERLYAVMGELLLSILYEQNQ